jgi:hypothetical protein
VAAGDQQQVVQPRIDLVEREVHVLEDVAVLAGDLLLHGGRDIDRDAFLHEAEVRHKELKILKVIGREHDYPRQRIRGLEPFLVELPVSL